VHVDGSTVRDYDTEQLWSAIGLVPSRYLFSGTVADNLRYASRCDRRGNVDRLRVAAADDFVRPNATAGDAGAQGGINFSAGSATIGDRACGDPPGLPSICSTTRFSALDVHTERGSAASLRDRHAESTGDCLAAHFDRG